MPQSAALKTRELPSEIISKVISFMPAYSAGPLATVSKQWQAMVNERVYRHTVFLSAESRNEFFEQMAKDLGLKLVISPMSASTIEFASPDRLVAAANDWRIKRWTRVRSLHFGLGPQPAASPTESTPGIIRSSPTKRSAQGDMDISPQRRRTSQSSSVSSPRRSARLQSTSNDSPMSSELASPRGLEMYRGTWDLTLGMDDIEPYDESPSPSPRRQAVSQRSSLNQTSPLRPVPAPIITSPSHPSISNLSSPSSAAYGTWKDRFISPFLPLIPYLVNLSILNLSGTHMNDSDFQGLMSVVNLAVLDISYSTIKDKGMQSLARQKRLRSLNVSGIFRFGRNHQETLMAILHACKEMKKLIVRECPELDLDAARKFSGLQVINRDSVPKRN